MVVPDVSTFAAKQQQAAELYRQLKSVREDLLTMETAMFKQMPANTKAIQVSANNTRMWLQVQSQKRRAPVSEAYLCEQLFACLQVKFAEVQPQELQELSVYIADAIWSHRSTKTASRLVLRDIHVKKRRLPR
jgi:hypothetical protein